MKVTATEKSIEHFQINFEVHIFSPFDLQVKFRIEMFIIFILFCFIGLYVCYDYCYFYLNTFGLMVLICKQI